MTILIAVLNDRSLDTSEKISLAKSHMQNGNEDPNKKNVCECVLMYYHQVSSQISWPDFV